MSSDDDQIQQAAILLMSMGRESAAEVLKMLKPKQVEKLVAIMQELDDVTEKDMVATFNEFLVTSSTRTGLGISAKDYIKDALVEAVGQKRAGSILDKSRIEEKSEALDALNWQPAKNIAELITNEHPQVIAIIFTYLDEEKAANVLSLLPKSRCSDIVKRLSKIGPISPLALEELEAMLSNVLVDNSGFRELALGGIDTAANIVNYLNSDLENEIMENMDKFDNALSEQIRDRMFPFEKLGSIDDRSLQGLLRNVSSDVLSVALKGADDKIRESFLRNMSGRAAEMLKDDLEAMGPVQLSKVEAAQKEIVTTAQRMSKDGEIILSQDSGDMIM